jgi:hypothetical protein
VTDQWVPPAPTTPPQPPSNPLPPANSWNDVAACSAGPNQPSIVNGIVISGVPATVSSAYWQVSLNDGSSPPNFQINQVDGQGNLVSTAVEISPSQITFNEPILLSRDPVEPMEAVTLEYLEAHPTGIPEAPTDNYAYARYMATWERLPQTYLSEAPSGQIFGRFNGTWAPVPIQADAPSDGNTYGRSNGAWSQALAITGGTITGSLTVNTVLTVQGSNSLVLNTPATGSNQKAILGTTANVSRWQLVLGDQTPEGANNAGCNFILAAYSLTGGFLGNWLTIARATGSAVFAGPVTVQQGLAVNGLLALQGPSDFYLPGGTAGQVLQTNGSGGLSWQTPPGASGGIPDAPTDGQLYGRQDAGWAVISSGGGIADAPSDGTLYGRKSAAWAHLTHADITDWAAQLAGYYPASNPSGYQTAAQVTAVLPVASSTTPAMNGTAAVGTGTTWARADHVHPSDTSRAPLASPAFTGVPTVPTAAAGTNTTQAASTAFVTAAVANPNRVDNGDMWVDQHNSGASIAVPALSGLFCPDRFAAYNSVAISRFTIGQNLVAAVPGLPPGFTYALGIQSTSAYTPIAGAVLYIQHGIEADAIGDLWQGLTTARSFTVSFWARSSLTGNFSFAVNGGAATTSGGSSYRSYVTTFSLPTANTWTKIAITIPGDTLVTSAWPLWGAVPGMYLTWDLGSGSTYQSSTLNAWQTNAGTIAATGAVRVCGTNGATYAITGVKLEPGNVATPWVNEPLATKLARCQRYYQNIGIVALAGYNVAGNGIYGVTPFLAPMRATPTITFSSITYNNAFALAVSDVSSQVLFGQAGVTADGMGIVNAAASISAEI